MRKIGPHIISPLFRNWALVNYCPEYKTILDSYTNKPSAQTSKLQNEFVKTLVDAGLWAKNIQSFLFAHDSNIGSDALKNIKSIGTKDAILAYTSGGANPSLVEHSGYTQGTGSKSYIRTQWNPKTDSPSLLNGITVVNFLDNTGGVDSFSFGLGTASAGIYTMYMAQNFSSKYYTAINNASATPYFSDAESRGFFGMTRLASNSIESYVNQKKYTASTASTDLPNGEMILLAANLNTTIGYHSTNTLAFWGVFSKLTTAEIRIIRQAIGKYMQSIGRGYYYFVCDGDSLTAGSGSTGGLTYPQQLSNKFLSSDSKRTIFTSFGVAGQTLTQMESDAATQIDPLYDTLQDVLIAWGGVNDFGLELGTSKETIYARYVTYCTNRKAAGWKVYAATMLPQSYSGYTGRTEFEAERIWFNNQVRTNLSTIVNGIIDLAGDSRIGDSGDELNTTYYTADKIHLNNTGYGIVSDLVYDAIKTDVITVN